MSNPDSVQMIHVPHLGGIDAAYKLPFPYDPSKPTLVLINSFTTCADFFAPQFEDSRLTRKINLLAIELLGHGKTRTRSEQFTYWDSAIMNLQVVEALGIKKVFALGVSQGGWVAVRMALLAPDKIQGIIPTGTSMDYESDRTRRLGCWDGPANVGGLVDAWTSEDLTPTFEPEDGFCDFLMDIGYGKDCEKNVRDHWKKTIKANYRGDEGRRRARMAAIALKERDGMHGRLFDVKCPVMWVHGTADVVFSAANAEEEIRLFTNAVEARLVKVDGGQHFVNASHTDVVNEAILQFVTRWNHQASSQL